MEKIVQLNNVTVRYDETTALEGVSLDIYRDDFLGIIGPNGGGKTTLVKAILGTLPHSGDIAYSYRARTSPYRLPATAGGVRPIVPNISNRGRDVGPTSGERVTETLHC